MSSPRLRRPTRFGLCALTLATAALTMGACSGNIRHDRVHSPSLRSNLTPELMTSAQRADDVDNALAIMADTNGRLFNEDLGSVWYTDRPSRLHRGPSPR